LILDANPGLNNYYVASTSPDNIYNIDAKIDENLSDKSRFFIRHQYHCFGVTAAPLGLSEQIFGTASGGSIQLRVSGSVIRSMKIH